MISVILLVLLYASINTTYWDARERRSLVVSMFDLKNVSRAHGVSD